MVYVTGDMHGDIARFDSPAVKRLKKGDTLIICGDFGFVWDNSKAEQKTLKKLGSKKYNICFIDGTHELAVSESLSIRKLFILTGGSWVII